MSTKWIAASGLLAATLALAPLSTPSAEAAQVPAGQAVLVAADLPVAQFIVQRRSALRPSYGGYGAGAYGTQFVVPGTTTYVVQQPRTYYPGYAGYPSGGYPVYNNGFYNGGGYPYGGFNQGFGGFNQGFGGFNQGFGGRGINIPLGGRRGITIGF